MDQRYKTERRTRISAAHSLSTDDKSLDVGIPSRRTIHVCDRRNICANRWSEEFNEIAYTLATCGDGLEDVFVRLGFKERVIF